ncbi:MAG: hypothetical protein QOJ99_4307 [Bryobacterales bacterium]|nr:hypothetical protein [Bryobacterales bacterium]
MTRSAQNVSAAAQSQQGRQGSHLFVSGRNGAHARWPAAETLCYLGELNSSAQARWLTTVEVFNEQGDAQQ